MVILLMQKRIDEVAMSLRPVRTVFVAVVGAGGVARAAAKMREPAGRTRQIRARIGSGCRAVRSRGAPRPAPRGGRIATACRRVLLEFESLGERARALRGVKAASCASAPRRR